MSSGLRTIAIALMVALPLAAHAQIVMPMMGGQQSPGTIRVQVTLGGPIAVGGASGDEVKKLEMDARVKVYTAAKNECAALSDTFDADCKLLTLTLNSNNQFGSIPSVNVSGIAVYQLTPHKQTP